MQQWERAKPAFLSIPAATASNKNKHSLSSEKNKREGTQVRHRSQKTRVNIVNYEKKQNQNPNPQHKNPHVRATDKIENHFGKEERHQLEQPKFGVEQITCLVHASQAQVANLHGMFSLPGWLLGTGCLICCGVPIWSDSPLSGINMGNKTQEQQLHFIANPEIPNHTHKHVVGKCWSQHFHSCKTSILLWQIILHLLLLIAISSPHNAIIVS